jgi:hypothetical protein
MDFGSFFPDLLANVVAGAAIVFGGYWFLDRKLRLQERGERAEEAEAERRRNREAVLRSVHRSWSRTRRS